MITPEELSAKLWSVPKAKDIFDKMVNLPLWDAAYFLFSYEHLLEHIAYEAGLRNAPFVNDPAAQPVPPRIYVGPRLVIEQFNRREMMLLRLRAFHPDASDDRLLEAIKAAGELYSTKAWPLMDYDLTRLREEMPGFQQSTYELAYHDFRVANR
ncbi:hypothetical protein [Mesorhizobium sp. RIZ17]|uniref:hypothetical protein n=1 Tax=Mesorhizobium sp. RIZ17 TaxID=3132743 RepID=UPI003DA92F79